MQTPEESTSSRYSDRSRLRRGVDRRSKAVVDEPHHTPTADSLFHWAPQSKRSAVSNSVRSGSINLVHIPKLEFPSTAMGSRKAPLLWSRASCHTPYPSPRIKLLG